MVLQFCVFKWFGASHFGRGFVKSAFLFLQFGSEEDAEKAVIGLNNRWFNGQPIHAELSPVTDFREACCRQYEMR